MTDNAFTPQQGVPTRLSAGDLWTWRADGFADVYPDPSYALTFHIQPRSGGTPIVAAAAADTDGWLVTVPSATTINATPGEHTWALVATRQSDGAVVTICTGALEVTASATSNVDTRSTAEKHLAAINAVLDGRITKDVESYTIEGRALTRVPMADLYKLRGKYQAEVNAERRARSGKGRFGVRKIGMT